MHLMFTHDLKSLRRSYQDLANRVVELF